MAVNLLTLLLTKQDRDNIKFAVWQLRPDKRFLLLAGPVGIFFFDFDEVIDLLREAEDKKLLPDGAALNTIRHLQSQRRPHPGMNK